jgi:uroporphyrinogen decarboxylase
VTKRERTQAAIDRAPVDRVPYAFWRHFPDADHSPRALAEATLAFQARWGSDFIKLTPAGGYAVREWGCVESAEVHPDGHRPCATCAVRTAGDWAKIRPLDPAAADGYAPQVEALIRMGGDDRADCAILPTLFSPLSLARKLSADRLPGDLRDHPGAVATALEAITETLIRYATLVLDEGAGGIFYSIQTASLSVCSESEYATFGEPYDRRVLGSLEGRSGLTIVHCHGDRLLWGHLARLPGQAWNWDDRTTAPSLGEGKALVEGAVMGGLDQWRTLRDGTPARAAAETRDAIAQTGGIGVIIGPGCVVPPNAPDANLSAVVEAVDRR